MVRESVQVSDRERERERGQKQCPHRGTGVDGNVASLAKMASLQERSQQSWPTPRWWLSAH